MQRALAIVLGLVAALVACLFALLARPSSRAESGDVVSVDPRPELRAILEELRGLRADLRASISNAPREVVETKAQSDEQLERAIAELIAELRARDGTPGSRPTPRYAREADGYESIEAIVPDADNHKKHLFWSLQEVRDRYGEPDWVNNTDDQRLILGYTRKVPPKSVEFVIFQGLVIACRVN